MYSVYLKLRNFGLIQNSAQIIPFLLSNFNTDHKFLQILRLFIWFMCLTSVKCNEKPHTYLKDKHNTTCFWVRLNFIKLSLSAVFVASAVQRSTTTRKMAAGLQCFLLLFAFFWYCLETFLWWSEVEVCDEWMFNKVGTYKGNELKQKSYILFTVHGKWTLLWKPSDISWTSFVTHNSCSHSPPQIHRLYSHKKVIKFLPSHS